MCCTARNAPPLTDGVQLVKKLDHFIHKTLVEDNLQQMSVMLSATLHSLLEERDELRKCVYGKALPTLQTVTLVSCTPAAAWPCL